MSSLDANIKSARETVNELFSQLKIKRIIFVDDEYDKDVTVADLIGKCTELALDRETSIGIYGPFNFDVDGIWQAQIKTLWESLTREQRIGLYQTTLISLNHEGIKYLGNLDQILQDHEFIKMSPNDWDSKKNSYLSEASKKKTFFLFDQDFSGTTSHGLSLSGIKYIQEALTLKRNSNNVICGLLSHTFSPEEEYDKWDAFSTEYSIEKHKFALISKQRLSNDPIGFAKMVKLSAINRDCKELVSQASKAIKKGHKEALNSIAKINIYDFEHIVFQSSYREGVWEPDTLFRLFNLFLKQQAREIIQKEEKVHKISSKIRSISTIQTDTIASKEHSSWKIQYLEIYENVDFLNKFHRPVDLGDIFEKTDNGKKYIVIGQPCDLMVREAGKRKHTVNEVVLAKIIDDDEVDYPDAFYELPYFNNGKKCHVKFQESEMVKLCVLDFCVFQESGFCEFSISDVCPKNLIPAWSKHYSVLKKDVDNIIRKYDEMKKAGRGSEVLKLFVPTTSNSQLFKGTVDLESKKLKYECKRIGRLNQPFASALLSKYGNYISRPAFEHDFGKE